MKKHFYICFLLNSFYLPSSHTTTGSCYASLKDKESFADLIEELHNPDLVITSNVSPYFTDSYIENAILPSDLQEHSSNFQEGENQYSFFYIPPQTGEKGRIVLSFTTVTKGQKRFTHYIYWNSGLKNPHLDAEIVKAIFNKIYETVYGKDLDWFVQHKVISKIISYNGTGPHNQLNPNDIFDFDALLFKDKNERLKHLLIDVMKSSDQMEDSALPHPKMPEAMQRIILESHSR